MLRPQDIAERLRVDPRSVRRAIAAGALPASRVCGLRILAIDAAAWWRAGVVARAPELLQPIKAGKPNGGGLETDLLFPYEALGGLWLEGHYKTWRRRIYVPSAENIGLSTPRPYDLRHTCASLLIAEKRLSIAEIAEQLGDEDVNRARRLDPRDARLPTPAQSQHRKGDSP